MVRLLFISKYYIFIPKQFYLLRHIELLVPLCKLT